MVKKYFWSSSMRKPFSSNSFYLVVLRKITISVTKMTMEENRFFFTICNWPNGPVKAIILPRFQFEGKLMYESVKYVRHVKTMKYFIAFWSTLKSHFELDLRFSSLMSISLLTNWNNRRGYCLLICMKGPFTWTLAIAWINVSVHYIAK